MECFVKITAMLQNPLKHTHTIWCSETRTFLNFINILRADFPPIFLRQKSTKLKCKCKKLVRKSVGEIDVVFIFINSLKLNKIWDTNNGPGFCGDCNFLWCS